VLVSRRAPVRLLTLTTLFPNALHPRHGIFVANRLRLLRDTGRVDATVVAAVPWFPGYYREYAGVPARESIAGFDVHHPRYLNWPKIGMRRQPDALASALLQALRRPELAGHTFDVVDAHYFYPDGVAAAIVARELGLPLVITARGSDVNLIADIAFARARMLRAASSAAALIAVSQALKERMTRIGMAPDSIRVLRNGVDTTAFSPVDRIAARARLGLDPACPLVAIVGNLVAEKGIEIAVHAIARNAAWRLIVVGEGPERDALRGLSRRIAAGRVEFREPMAQAQLRYVYSAADVLALPSLREGWPNVVLESMACGTPVAAAAVGGVPEIIRDGAPGVIVRERSVEAWMESMRMLLQARLTPQRVRTYAARFGWNEVVSEQCALYEVAAHTNDDTARSLAPARQGQQDVAA
jgi:glycosyltransferase involved in cell wall biosynthesis